MQSADGHRKRRDGRERTCLIDSGRDGLQLFLRGLRSMAPSRRGAVLYLHGATFPSALSVAYRFDGMSWRDAMCDAGFDVWALDFLGFGGSDRYPEMESGADANAPLGLAADGVAQVEAAVQFILDQGDHQQVSLVTHSWGSMPAGLFAAKHPTLVDRIVMFAPLARREGPRYTPRPTLPAWKLVTNDQQWTRFVEDVPPGEPSVLARDDFTAWSEAYLGSDPAARSRSPPAVKTPTGPLVEILRAWHGELAWEPQEVQAPVAIIRGAWDGLVTDHDAHWLFERLAGSAERRDIKIGRGTHLTHLEVMRTALWRESIRIPPWRRLQYATDHDERRASHARPSRSQGFARLQSGLTRGRQVANHHGGTQGAQGNLPLQRRGHGLSAIELRSAQGPSGRSRHHVARHHRAACPPRQLWPRSGDG